MGKIPASHPNYKWTRLVAALTLLLLSALACNLPFGAADSPPPPTVVVQEAQPIPPTVEISPTTAQSSGITHAAVNVPPSLALLPADLPFQMDCSALDPSHQADCDTYLANTRDIVYPFARQLTGTSLSACYDAVYYAIVPDEQLSEHQGEAIDNHVTYALRSTLNLNAAPLYDSHEILHVIAYCNGALDQHVFHGALESQIDLTLTGARYQWPGRDNIANWLESKLVPEVKQPATETTVATPAPGGGGAQGETFDTCLEIYGSLVTILYYDAGIETIQQVYRATINPGPEIVPNAKLVNIFGESLGRQFQVVVNALKQNPVYQLDVPECGIE